MRLLRAVGWALIGSGLLILAFLAYQLWATTLFTARAQDRLEAEFQERTVAARAEMARVEAASDEEPRSAAVEQPADDRPPPLLVEEAPEEGEPIGRLVIQAAGVDAVVVQGVQRSDLKLGPGHMSGTPMPGQPGNSVLSGHRTTYGAPFFDLDLLGEGDRISMETAIGLHIYEVRELTVVGPNDVWVLEPRPGAWLTLTTCDPKFSARHRLVVFAELVEGPNQLAVSAAS